MTALSISSVSRETEEKTMANAIEIKNLTKQFKEKTAVDNISLTVAEGELFSLLGVNGAGILVLELLEIDFGQSAAGGGVSSG